MSVLKPCPFCGSANIKNEGQWGMFCQSCGTCGPDPKFGDGEPAFWNTRAPDPAVAVLQAEVERLRVAAQAVVDAWLNEGRTDLLAALSTLGCELEAPTNA
jgi:hypothetical protein